jgi:hypothetical protein
MSWNSGPPLRPRNGHTLIVGIVARISGCADQRDVSREDQIDHAKEVVAELWDGPVEYRIIATVAKGEALDRPELELLEAELRKGELDLLIMEDLGRLVRGGEALRLLGVAVDHGTRAIAINDYLDTADPHWEQGALQAAIEHVGHNAHTSRRLKHKLLNRFLKFGGATSRPIAGYIVPDHAQTYDDWQGRLGNAHHSGGHPPPEADRQLRGCRRISQHGAVPGLHRLSHATPPTAA